VTGLALEQLLERLERCDKIRGDGHGRGLGVRDPRGDAGAAQQDRRKHKRQRNPELHVGHVSPRDQKVVVSIA
jgi:hypothetical protein